MNLLLKWNNENSFRFLKLLCDFRIECMSHMGHFYDSCAFFLSFLEVDSRWSPFTFISWERTAQTCSFGILKKRESYTGL